MLEGVGEGLVVGENDEMAHIDWLALASLWEPPTLA
jgi:hypothetical protein